MNTPAHLIVGLAAFSRADQRAISLAALVGALLPDASLYVLVGWALVVQQVAPDVIFGTLYFSEGWQAVFAVDNSVFVWGAVLALALWWRAPVGIALAGAALLHIGLDLPLHHDDGRPHFWPVSDLVFESPFSYWDPAHGAGWIAPLETGVVLGLAALLWRRHRSGWARAGIAALALAQLAPTLVWAVMFGRAT